MSNAKTLKDLAEKHPDIRLLYVEDDESLRENTLRLLSSFFPTIDSANHGQEGLDKYKQEEYDIVISDLRMPVMGGIEMVRQIKELNSDQIVIITSAHDETDYLLKLITMGVGSFILKPLDLEQFLSVLIKSLKIVNLRKIETNYKHHLEETVRQRTEELSTANKKLEEYNITLEQKVSQRTAALNRSLTEIEIANKKVMDSLEYAKMIQRSLLPNLDDVKTHLPNSFFIWKPRDIVGGDIYYADFFEDSFIISLIDCTGHGVPGALMTMIASSGLRRIIRDENQRKPAEILKRLNFFIKTSLQQDTAYAISDDGLEAALCLVDFKKKTVSFAGSRMPLISIHNGQANIIKGDRVSIGYRNSNLAHSFREHTIELKSGMRFYMHSDGYVDQIGEQKPVSFGQRRLVELLQKNSQAPFEKQKARLLEAFYNFKGGCETRDDFTVVGFSLD
ncbi:MAG: response regulator [Deltaproteobacteria bacterium]|nr:response regulator [Deltaproteobacteria bacterium]MBT4089917.1 response regulator [Deltaproteobacteria bacterium]MBT4264288.1 response regulator [Deltaproteobacteria bacterium]MBT6501188.1 response regulator [Deltaproteobacteria bacterium]MBT7155429.1 response regulator [Deltaproteobacteria bacterium]